jgi:hypothetical protein
MAPLGFDSTVVGLAPDGSASPIHAGLSAFPQDDLPAPPGVAPPAGPPHVESEQAPAVQLAAPAVAGAGIVGNAPMVGHDHATHAHDDEQDLSSLFGPPVGSIGGPPVGFAPPVNTTVVVGHAVHGEDMGILGLTVAHSAVDGHGDTHGPAPTPIWMAAAVITNAESPTDTHTHEAGAEANHSHTYNASLAHEYTQILMHQPTPAPLSVVRSSGLIHNLSDPNAMLVHKPSSLGIPPVRLL